MKIKTLIATSMLLGISSLAYADIAVYNKTKASATANLNGGGMCSSAFSGGILRANSSYSIPQAAMNLACAFGPCKVHLYMSDNCSGSRVAIVTIDKSRGVTDIRNDNVGNFKVTGGGNTATITGGPARHSIFDFFFGR